MAYIRDLWMKKNPDQTSRIKKVRSARWGKGKRWQAVWVENGNEITKTFHTHDEAELYAARAEVGQADGTWITKDKADVTLSDLWEPWLASKGNISDKSRRDYLSYWSVHIRPQWGQTPCAHIQRSVINAWIPTLSTMKGESAMRKVGFIIHGILDLAVELGVIHQNPIRTGDLPKQKKSERRYLKITEVDELIRQAPPEQSKLLLRVLIMTGLRPGEAKGLKVKDLDPIRGRLMIRRDVDDLGHEDSTKTRNHRDVPIGGEILVLLDRNAQGKDPDAWLIPDERGRVWTTARWRVVWKTCASGLGLVTSTPTNCATLPHPSPSQPELMLKQYNLCSATPVPL
ncbi:Phage integrase [Corynebacterium ulcerans FRC58]|uniref:Tyr recombinase domain-containing protein n=2 Tax=Corynebacterium ulcerans TaxID=65058 RepID=A0A0C4XA61_CORUL|nr:tyrosine-type recombinase/integrase [Corynebacterium ulcerans]AJE75811.1 integrase [Corynebacterium ulcerans]AKN76028.1 Phage integrase [Corynebacterium ulcerans FRC58]